MRVTNYTVLVVCISVLLCFTESTSKSVASDIAAIYDARGAAHLLHRILKRAAIRTKLVPSRADEEILQTRQKNKKCRNGKVYDPTRRKCVKVIISNAWGNPSIGR